MRHIEKTSGTGTATNPNGQSQSVAYKLDTYQEYIAAGNLSDPNAMIPGMKRLVGRVQPLCFFGQADIVLTMQDGRKMKFFFTDTTGEIAFSGWLD